MTRFIACLIAGSFLLSGQTPQEIEFFEAKIRPIFANNCYLCHSHEGKVSRGGLVLDTKTGPRQGGDSGPAVVPGDVEASVLIHAVRQTGKRKMPPGGKLPDAAIADLEKWIAMGAPDPRQTPVAAVKTPAIDFATARKFWAFQPVSKPAPPQPRLKWGATPIDKFLAAKLEDKKLAPNAPAPKDVLLRRVYLDLIGVPPTPEQTDAFVADKSKDAFAKIVDSLLSSPQFGERWGRHWLDVARYGESMGRTRNQPFPYAWRYRDWVIDAFNADMPYDQFIQRQIAGDLLDAATPADRNANLIATGLLSIGAHDLNELDKRQYDMDVVDEQIHTVSKAFLGLTVGCARCHDHKFDPIPTADYYALAGIFRSTEMRNGLRRRPPLNQVFFTESLMAKLDGVEPYPNADAAQLQAQRADLWSQIQKAERDRDRIALRDLNLKWMALPMPQNLAMGAAESPRKINSEIMERGDPHAPGAQVSRGALQILSPEGQPLKIPDASSGRLELARWIASPENPMTARVMANRIWQHLLGRGLVETPDNFGRSGSGASNKDLLNFLAARLVENKWSIKKTIREVVLTSAYQLSGEHNKANYEIDPDNKALWRANRHRLEVEAIRDSMLLISGALDLDRPEGSPVGSKIGKQKKPKRAGAVEAWELTENFRSIYVPIVRNQVNRFYETFDFPEPSEPRGIRDVTTVPPQALFLMNSPFVANQAKSAATRLLEKVPAGKARVERAYREVLGRAPTPAEVDRALTFVSAPGSSEPDAWAQFFQALFASAEFRYRS